MERREHRRGEEEERGEREELRKKGVEGRGSGEERAQERRGGGERRETLDGAM